MHSAKRVTAMMSNVVSFCSQQHQLYVVLPSR
jgi:predicted DNA-binding protein (UPF0251 family)